MLTDLQAIIELGTLPLNVVLGAAIWLLWRKVEKQDAAKDELNKGLLKAYQENTKAVSEWVILEKARRND